MAYSNNSKCNRATEALMWNFYMIHIYGPKGESWRNYWRRFKSLFLKQGEYFCLRELEGRDLPFELWSFMELTTEGENGKRIDIISDIKNPENSKIEVYNKKTYVLEKVLTPNLDIIFDCLKNSP